MSKATPEGTLSYTYDANGLLASMASSNPNGVSVAYAYDNLNRLTGVTDNRLPAGQNTTTYTYDGASYVVTAAYPNGLQSSFTWDSRHRLTALASPAAGYSYALDPVGNRTSATEASGRTLSWSYDGVNRLTNESVAQDPAGRNGSVSYTLDPVGNRLAAASTLAGVASSSAAYSPDDLLSTESYDLNGNVLATGGRSFAYDSENRLVGMNGGAAGSQVAIQYDGWGNRVAETANGTTTRFLVDDLNPTGYPQVVEELVNGAVTRHYTNGLQRISENQHISGKWTPSFYGYDGMGNVRQLSNLAGTITDNYEYDAFGNVILSTGNTPNNYLYRGEQYDATLGLQYLRARYYNPVTGRFLSQDPWSGTIGDPASLHKYSYAEGNPIAGSDPSGFVDISDYGSLALISEGSVAYAAGLPKVGQDVNCILYSVAATLAAISNAERNGAELLSVNIDYSHCSANVVQDRSLPPPDPNHNHTLVIRKVAGQGGNPAGHVTVQVDCGKEVGFGPLSTLPGSTDQSTPGQIEVRNPKVATKDAVTVNITGRQADAAKNYIDYRTKNPGNYKMVGNSCVNFGEQVLSHAGGRAPNATLPGVLIDDIRQQQYHDRSTQTPP